MYDQFRNYCGNHRTNAKHTRVRSSVFAGMRVRASASRCELLHAGVFAGTGYAQVFLKVRTSVSRCAQVRASVFEGTPVRAIVFEGTRVRSSVFE